ncbi:MAG: helix-turn-helix transcriptional regulator [Magnetococcales bacterium]|nr:helix-turn-helix transcriptional regulator [Magnetococcales bacterium]
MDNERYEPVSLNHDEMLTEWMTDPEFKTAYDALDDEFRLFDELLAARKKAGMTQAQVAAKMGNKTPSVVRLEAGGGKERHSPSIATLRRYAEAVGCRLEIKLVPR